MKSRSILLAATILVSAVAMGGSAAGVAPATGAAAPAPTPTATNGSTGSNGSVADPRPVSVPPDRLENLTVNTSSLPESIGEHGAAAAAGSPAANATVGTTKQFPSVNLVTGEVYFERYTLRRVSEHGAIWVANDLSWPENDSRPDPTVSEAQLDYLIEEFEGNIYPTETDLFREPEPRYGNQSALARQGKVPNDYYETSDRSRTIMLVDNVRDENYFNGSYPLYTTGFFSTVIENLTDRNVVTIDAYDWDNGTGTPASPWRPENGSNASHQVEGTFAHEYQHLLHSDQDPDEASWVNEGLSDYAELAVGYDVPTDHVPAYEDLPSNSLTDWSDQGAINVLADYGAGFLFQLYGQQRYGDAFVRGVFNDTDASITGVNDTLDRIGSSENFTTLYQDFSAALVGDRGADGPAPYSFERAELNVTTSDDVLYTRDNLTASWGNAYETIDVSDGATVDNITVSGVDAPSTRWREAPNPVDVNETVIASGAGDLTDRFAIFEANLSGASSPTLGFDTYYDIEQGWDYGFVQVSTDGGETWESLSNENTTDYLAQPESAYSPVVGNLPGFTGDTSGEWTEQTFDLSAYAGEDVLIAFRYVGDSSVQGNSSQVPGTGMYVRDVSVSGTNVSYDGSSIEPFRGIDEVRDEYVGYQYSVLALDESGELVDVKQYPVKTFATRESRTLTDLPTGANVSRLVLAITRASDQGEFGTVPYNYTVGYAGEGPTEPTEPSQPTDATNYQVDFVAGEPLDRLGGDYPLYAEQDRLLRFAHGNTDEGITQLGNAWANRSIRECVDYGHISRNNDTASVTFTVADDCGNVTLSLAAYEKPGPGFDPAETQTLLDASTGSYGAGTHTLVVGLPDGEADAE